MRMAVCAVCMGEFHTVTLNERVCQGCLADAKLGRLVRAMPSGSRLLQSAGEWTVYGDGITGLIGWHKRPEEALERAMGDGK